MSRFFRGTTRAKRAPRQRIYPQKGSSVSIYIYQGSMSADTIQGTDYVFVDGKEYSLPDNNSKTKRMIRQGTLILKTKTDEISLEAQTEADCEQRLEGFAEAKTATPLKASNQEEKSTKKGAKK